MAWCLPAVTILIVTLVFVFSYSSSVTCNERDEFGEADEVANKELQDNGGIDAKTEEGFSHGY